MTEIAREMIKNGALGSNTLSGNEVGNASYVWVDDIRVI